MFNYIWPLLIIVFANTLYQICAKGIPEQMNTYASMTITYAVATLFSAAAFFVTTKGGNILKEFSHTNWATIVLGIVITGLEVSFIFVTDPDLTREICTKLVQKFTDDQEYLEKELANALPRVQCLELEIEHMTGKLVNES